MHATTLTRGLLVCGALILAAGTASGQSPYGSFQNDQQPISSAPVAKTPTGAAAVPELFCAPALPRVYASAEYLFWWMKSAHLPLPIISSGPLDTNIEGLLPETASSTYILYGPPWPNGIGGYNKQNFPPFSGTRLTLGGWLDGDQRVA